MADNDTPPKKMHTLAITLGGALLSRMLLQAPEWAKSAKLARRAAKLARRFPKLPKELTPEAEEEAFSVEVDEKERDTLKQAVEHHVNGGKLANTEHLEVLLSQLGLGDEE